MLRWVLTVSASDSTSIYGPLAAPIAIMIWLYILAIALLIGAALNASFDHLWPEAEPERARVELVRRLRARTVQSLRWRTDQPATTRQAPGQAPRTECSEVPLRRTVGS